MLAMEMDEIFNFAVYRGGLKYVMLKITCFKFIAAIKF